MPWLFLQCSPPRNGPRHYTTVILPRKKVDMFSFALLNRLSLFWHSVCSCGWYETPTVADFRQPVWYLSTHEFGLDACCLSYTICPPNTQWSVGNSKIANPHCSGFKYLQICILSKNVSANPRKIVTAVSIFLLHLFIYWVGCVHHSMPMKIKGQLTGVSILSPTMWMPGIKLRWASLVVGTFTHESPGQPSLHFSVFFWDGSPCRLSLAWSLHSPCSILWSAALTDNCDQNQFHCLVQVIQRHAESIEFWVVKAHVSNGVRSQCPVFWH